MFTCIKCLGETVTYGSWGWTCPECGDMDVAVLTSDLPRLETEPVPAYNSPTTTTTDADPVDVDPYAEEMDFAEYA